MTSKEYQYELKIPNARIAVLIGKEGEIKKELEKDTGTDIDVDSKEGDVLISGRDAVMLYNTLEVIKAIGRGFNPDIAKLLLKSDHSLEVIDIEDFARTKNDMKRVKGRLIGTEGKARKTIEDLSGCYISVYGKTVSIIGSADRISLARYAVEGLLRGAKHGNIYKWLEKRKKELAQSEII